MIAHRRIVHTLKNKGGFYFFALAGFMMFVGLSVYYSQQYPSIMGAVFSGNNKAVVEYLLRTKQLGFVQEDMYFFEKETSNTVSETIKNNEKKIDKTIVSLLVLREKYKNSPEILYNLSLLYKQKGNNAMADLYLQQARQIDPSLQ